MRRGDQGLPLGEDEKKGAHLACDISKLDEQKLPNGVIQTDFIYLIILMSFEGALILIRAEH